MNTNVSNPLDALSRDEVLQAWQAAKIAVTKAQETEMAMRKYVVSRAFPLAEEGTNTAELGNGYSLKAVVKYNYNLKDNATVERTLVRISQIGNNGPFVAAKLVKTEYSFLLTEFRMLESNAAEGSEEAKAILKEVHGMLNVTEAALTLSIKEPKVKK